MSDLHAAIDDYLTLRRSLGHKLERHDRFLHDFVEFLHTHGTNTITTALAIGVRNRFRGGYQAATGF